MVAPVDESFVVDAREARLKRMRQSVLTTGRLFVESPPRGYREVALMLTLTYRPGVEWEPRHVTELQGHVRRWLKYRGLPCRYVWVAELQKRGVVHYHVLVWVPHRCRLPFPDRAGWWPYGDTNVVRATSATGYLSKYVSKGPGAGTFPRGCRMHGAGGLSQAQARVRRWWLLPSYIRDINRPEHDIRRAAGGGFVCRELALAARSPFGLVAVSKGGVRLLRIGPPPPALPPLRWVCPVAQREVARFDMSQGRCESSGSVVALPLRESARLRAA